MKVCGIELKRDQVTCVVLSGNADIYTVEHDDCARFKLEKSKNQEAVKSFRDEILNYFNYQDFSAIGIKERASKGRFSGSPLSFKIEGLMQTSDYAIQIVHSASLASKVKEVILEYEQLKKFQHKAFELAYYLLLTHD